jgi:hypothetical protein
MGIDMQIIAHVLIHGCHLHDDITHFDGFMGQGKTLSHGGIRLTGNHGSSCAG